MDNRTCTVDDCDRAVRNRQLCGMHYQRLLRTGTTDPPTRWAQDGRSYKPPQPCSIDGCDRDTSGGGKRGMCGRHYQRLMKHGDPTIATTAKPKVSGVEPCSVEGCTELIRSAGLCARHYTRVRRYGDPSATGSTKQCVICGAQFVKRTRQVCCSIECRKVLILEYGREYQTALRRDNPKPPVETYRARCRFCSGEFDATKRRFQYCSNACYLSHRSRGEDPSSRRRKDRLRNAWVEKFSRLEIFERDGWICGICNEPIDPDLKYPDRYSASLDHIISLKRGGEHSRANTRAAHLTCNCRKSWKMDRTMRPEAIKL